MFENLLFWVLVGGTVVYFKWTTRVQRDEIFWRCTTALLIAAVVGEIYSHLSAP